MYVITRYDDVRTILLDTERFSTGLNGANYAEQAIGRRDLDSEADLDEAERRVLRRRVLIKPDHPEEAAHHAQMARHAAEMTRLYEDNGWLPASGLQALDEPEHMQERRLFDHAFRPAVIKGLDPMIKEFAHRLMDDLVRERRCEWVSQFAVPLPLYVLGRQVGVPDEDLPQIKTWTDAFIKRLGLMQTVEEMRWAVEMEIEAQHYFQKCFERLRREPDDTLLSVLVNDEIPEWGRPLTDNELHAEVMGDLFVAGAETTTNALAEGVVLLIEQPEAWERLKSDPEKYLEPFIEEVVRLVSPVQGLLRQATVDVELRGMTIPAGAVVNLRYAAANRDERQFERAQKIDLDRERPRQHLGFGVGNHHCLGAPLARREMYFGFQALVERVDRLWLVKGSGSVVRDPNFFLRVIKEVHLGFS